MGLVGQGARALLCGTAVTLLAGTTLAWAQAQQAAATTDEQVTTESEKKGRATALQRLVLGAGQEKVAIDTPSAVTVVEQQDIDDEQPQTINEIIKNIPGINATGSDRLLGQNFNIRGQGAPETSGDGGRIIVNVDGVGKFYEQYRMGSFFSDPELYKRVEVLRGPAFSTLYGSGALGGVVNFTTKDASDFIADGETGALRVKTSWDSNGNGWLFNTTLAQRMGENAEFLLSGNYRQSDTFSDGNGNPIIGTNFTAWSGLAKGTFKVGDEGTLRLSYQRFDSDNDDQYFAQTGTANTFGYIDRRVVDTSLIAAYENPFSDNDMLDLKIQASYSNTTNEQRNHRAFPGIPISCGAGTLSVICDSDYGYETWQLSAQNTMEWRGDRWENFLTYGWQTAFQTRSAEAWLNNGTPLDSPNFHPQGTDLKTGFFVQNEYIWDDRLSIIPGVRYDWRRLSPKDVAVPAGMPPGTVISDSEDSAFSPKIAAHYKLTDNVAFFGSIAHTERMPTLDELYTTNAGASYFLPAYDLNKERSDNFEAGFALNGQDLIQSGDSAQIKVTGFYNKVKDLIIRNPALVAGPNPTEPGLVNINRATIYGFEIEAAYDSDYVFANANYSYLRGINDSATTPATRVLTSIAPHELGLTIGGKLPDYGVRFGWRSRIVAGPQDWRRDFLTPPTGFTSTRHSKAFDVHDLFVTWKPVEGPLLGWEGNFGVDNIFDKQYKEFLQNDVSKGRTFKLSLTKQFGW
ncbi:MAG: TonB-dependent receptor [Mesorhizobium sp.]